eukprot:972592-Karenia_brevis.AAC.1
MQIAGETVEVLSGDHCHKYLGRKLNLGSKQRQQFEIDFRHKQAWAAYHKFQHCLVNHQISLKLRLKLFDAVIPPTALFGLGAITMTAHQRESFGILQRKMLRNIVGWSRKADETWEETMHNMQDKIHHAMEKYHRCKAWEQEISKIYFNYAVYMAKGHERTPWKLLCTWDPSQIFDQFLPMLPRRGRGRPKSTWDH